MEPAAQPRTQAGSDLSDRSLTSARSTGAQCHGRRDRLDQRHSRADSALLVVERVNDGIGPGPCRFGCEPVNDHPGNQPTDRHHGNDHPRREPPQRMVEPGILSFGKSGLVTCNLCQ